MAMTAALFVILLIVVAIFNATMTPKIVLISDNLNNDFLCSTGLVFDLPGR